MQRHNLKLTSLIEAIRDGYVTYNYDAADQTFIPPPIREEIFDLANRSQKFYAGDLAELPNSSIQDNRVMNLPFPKTYIEFKDSSETGQQNTMDGHTFQMKGAHCCCLCDDDLSRMPDGLNKDFKEVRFKMHCFLVTDANHLDGGGKITSFIDTSCLVYAGIDHEDIPFFQFVRTPGCDYEAFQTTKQYQKIINGCVAAFLAILNCSNIGLCEVPAPAKLNKSRKEKNKPPFYQYKTLYVKSQKKSAVTIGENAEFEDADENRKSPCLHWRRGHIRKLANGKTIWIAAMLVGDIKEGVLEKDYVVGDRKP